MSRRSLPLLVAALAALAATGCKDRPDASREAKKVTPTSTDDATQPVVDEGFRFRLDWPGSGWKVLRERDARQISPDAVAGLTKQAVNAVVIAEHVPGVDLEAYADVILDNFAVEEPEITRTPASIGDHPAIELDVRGLLNGLKIRFRGRVVLRDGWAYQILAFGPEGMGSEADLDVAIAAFSLTPGEITGRATAKDVPDTSGVGWRVRANVWESAPARLRVAPPAGWRLMIGDELYRTNPDGDVGMVALEGSAYVAVLAEPGKGIALDEYRAARVAAMRDGREELPEPATVTVDGETVALTRLRDTGGVRMEYLFGVLRRADRIYQLTAWYPAALRADSQPKVGAALASLELLDDAEVGALADELAGLPDRQDVIGEGFAVRGGVYRDFAHGVTWRKPPGFWRVEAGLDARARNDQILFGADELTTGLQVQVIVEPWTASADEHRAVVEGGLVAGGLGVAARGDGAIGAVPAWYVEAVGQLDGLPFRYRATTAVHAGQAVQVLVWSIADHWPGEAAVAAVAANLELAAIPQVVPGPPFEDRRMGFAIDLPGSWTRRDATPTPLRPIGAAYEWRDGPREIMAMAFYAYDQDDDEWMLGVLEQMLREQYARLAFPAPRVEQTTVGELPGRHLTWDTDLGRIDAWLVQRGATYYGLLAMDRGKGVATAELARSSFRLID